MDNKRQKLWNPSGITGRHTMEFAVVADAKLNLETIHKLPWLGAVCSDKTLCLPM